MIHEIREEFFDLPLENYVLTFDDGLYSQFYYYPEFAKIPTEKYYFVSSGIICNGEQSMGFPDCETAHGKARSGNFEDYMTVEQISYLLQQPNVVVGGHSHSHTSLTNFDRITHKLMHLSHDINEMVEWFTNVLGHHPHAFCFPYNDDMGTHYRSMYIELLKRYGYTQFFGAERIPIESLIPTAGK